MAVAQRVGYESEAAFNRAFRRKFGIPPASWRRSHGMADGRDSLSGANDFSNLSIGEYATDAGTTPQGPVVSAASGAVAPFDGLSDGPNA